MKRFLSVFCAFILLIVLFSSVIEASDSQIMTVCSSVEYLENGDYIITELIIEPTSSLNTKNIASTKPGKKTATYYNSVGTRIWDVTVNGIFSYTYGVSATATSATATVNIYSTHASFVSKSAYTSGNTATATGTVAYNSVSTTMSVSVSCDKYGNLY